MRREQTIRLGRWLTQLRPLELALFLKWLLRVQRLETSAEGLKLWVDPASNFGRRVLQEGTYEPELTRALRQLLQPSQTFVDIGANEGWFSALAAKLVGPRGHVLACEPQERLWPAILRNLALNNLTNCQLLPFGIANETAQAVINLYPSLNTGSSNISDTKRRWETTQSIKLVPLSSILEPLGGRPVDLMKVDVEGFEFKVLTSAGAHLGTSIKRLVVEMHPAQLEALGSSEGAVTRLLEAKGYRKEPVGSVDVWTLENSP